MKNNDFNKDYTDKFLKDLIKISGYHEPSNEFTGKVMRSINSLPKKNANKFKHLLIRSKFWLVLSITFIILLLLIFYGTDINFSEKSNSCFFYQRDTLLFF
jgi:hypothetical protein